MYCFVIENKFNLVCIPKNGCSQVIKYISQYLNIFKSHNHSFVGNECSIYENIHSCASELFNYNPNLPTYLVTRKVELRILSYFKANYDNYKMIHENPTFNYFIENLDIFYNFDEHHLGKISEKLKLYNIKIDYLINLEKLEENLTNLFKEYNIDYFFKKEISSNNTSTLYKENDNVLYNTKYKDIIFPVNNDLFFNKYIINKIKDFYKDDLDFYIS